MTTPSRPNRLPGLTLAYPLSLGVFDKYEDAQRAVDTLSDQGFPVENVLIVGTELKQLERITGRLTQGRVAVGGLLSGLWHVAAGGRPRRAGRPPRAGVDPAERSRAPGPDRPGCAPGPTSPASPASRSARLTSALGTFERG